MATTATKRKSLELPVPEFFRRDTLSRIGELWMPNYQGLIEQAKQWRKEHDITNAATDTRKIALVGIDQQITFILPSAQLPVMGAVEDSIRECEFLYRNLGVINRVYKTLDTHTLWQIFHSIMLVDADGNSPTIGVPIADSEIQSGKWQINPEAAFAIFGDANKYSALRGYLAHYSSELASSADQYSLIPWPVHALLGSISHALLPAIEEAALFHNVVRGSQTRFEIKGGHPLTEAYSPYGPEVTKDQHGRPTQQKNTGFFDILTAYDGVIISGQAKSHCVRAFIKDHLNFVLARDPALAKKVYLVEDLMSPVVIPGVIDFTQPTDEAFARFQDAGMNSVKSTTPLADWPGMAEILAL